MYDPKIILNVQYCFVFLVKIMLIITDVGNSVLAMQHIIIVAYICRIIHQFVDILCFLCNHTLPVRELGLFLTEENVLELNFLCFFFFFFFL